VVLFIEHFVIKHKCELSLYSLITYTCSNGKTVLQNKTY